MFRNLKASLICLLLAVLSLAGFQGYLLLRKTTDVVASTPKQLEESRNAVIAAASQQIEAARKDLAQRADRQLTALRTTADDRLASIQQDTKELAFVSVSAANDRLGDTLGKVDAALELLKPAVNGAVALEASSNTLVQTYNALPGQIATELKPSFDALQPEITCRLLNGSGYGGCWHSRITALMGEAANVGGTFTKQFPLFSQSITGMASDAHGWTQKYVQPHPLTTGQKFKAAGQIVIGLGTAGLRGGVF